MREEKLFRHINIISALVWFLLHWNQSRKHSFARLTLWIYTQSKSKQVGEKESCLCENSCNRDFDCKVQTVMGQLYDWNENEAAARCAVRCRTQAYRYTGGINSMCTESERMSVCAVHFDLKWFNTSQTAATHKQTQCTQSVHTESVKHGTFTLQGIYRPLPRPVFSQSNKYFLWNTFAFTFSSIEFVAVVLGMCWVSYIHCVSHILRWWKVYVPHTQRMFGMRLWIGFNTIFFLRFAPNVHYLFIDFDINYEMFLVVAFYDGNGRSVAVAGVILLLMLCECSAKTKTKSIALCEWDWIPWIGIEH